jgi:hypothetical protein
VSFRTNGLKELQRRLETLASNIRAVEGTNEVPTSEALSPEFLAAHTRFTSIQELFNASGFIVETPEDFKAIPDEQWDVFIQNITGLSSWKEMLQCAAAAWTKKKLGLQSYVALRHNRIPSVGGG